MADAADEQEQTYDEGEPAEKEQTYEEWVAEEVGPRKVGGTYLAGSWGDEYKVLDIDRGPRETWPVWKITVQTVGTKERREHCTRWDPERGDRVISEPEPEGR